MQINEAKLNRIIREEIALRIIEQVIEEELDKFLLENEDLQAYKKQYRRSIVDAVRS